MDIRFTKMQGLGNDFVIMEATHLPPGVDLAKLAERVSDRHFGVGSDGLIVIAPPSDPSQFDSQFIFYNSDGSRAEMCGNGIRCFALYVHDRQLLNAKLNNPAQFRVETLAGLIQPRINVDRSITVDMGPPILSPERIPFKGEAPQPIYNFPLPVLDRVLPVTPVSMGNPHCIVFQEDLETPVDPAVFGPVMELHSSFPAKTNVEFIDVVNRKHLKVTVWERGCGFTLACGTGACASVVAGVLCGKTEHETEVELPGGSLYIRWDQADSGHVYMTGPAAYVFEGVISISDETFSINTVLHQQTPLLP